MSDDENEKAPAAPVLTGTIWCDKVELDEQTLLGCVRIRSSRGVDLSRTAAITR